MPGVEGSVLQHKLLDIGHARVSRRKAVDKLATQLPAVRPGLQEDELVGISHIGEFPATARIHAPQSFSISKERTYRATCRSWRW